MSTTQSTATAIGAAQQRHQPGQHPTTTHVAEGMVQ